MPQDQRINSTYADPVAPVGQEVFAQAVWNKDLIVGQSICQLRYLYDGAGSGPQVGWQ